MAPLPPTAASQEKTVARALTNAQAAKVIPVLLSILHAALAVTGTLDKSPTFDEPTHLTAGYSYWQRNDFRLDSENGNFPARWAALPLLMSQPRLPATTDPSWQRVIAGEAGRRFFYHTGNNPDRMLLPARAMMSILSGGLCLLIFFWAQKLFGPIGGLISETLAVFDPNLLANGALVTSDISAALFFCAAVWTTWKLFHEITFRMFLASAASVAGLFLSKMSAPLFAIMAAILALTAIVSRQSIELRLWRFRRVILEKRKKLLVVVIASVALGAVTFAAIWGAFGFRFAAFTDSGRPRQVLDWRWNYLVTDHTATDPILIFARRHHLLPEAYLYGLAYIENTSSGRPAFLDDQWSDIGFRSFFPRALFYKTPLPLLGLLAMATLAVGIGWKERWQKSKSSLRSVIVADWVMFAPINVLLLVYGAAAMNANLNIGFRYILPMYAVLFIFAGASVHLFRMRHARMTSLLVAMFLGWQVVESFAVRPHYLAYFNQIAGGPARGYHHLVDSSLDWGQDLPELKKWLDANASPSTGDRVYLAYFGAAEPEWYEIQATTLPEGGGQLAPLDPGLYCISATELQHVYDIEQGEWATPYEAAYQNTFRWLLAHRKIDNEGHLETEPEFPKHVEAFQRLRFARLCAYLRHQRPLANIGYSILVFRLSADDLSHALNGPPVELAPTVNLLGH